MHTHTHARKMLFIMFLVLFFFGTVSCTFIASHSCCMSPVCILKQFYAQQFFVWPVCHIPAFFIAHRFRPFYSSHFVSLFTYLHALFVRLLLMLFLSKFRSLIKYRNKIECVGCCSHVHCRCDKRALCSPLTTNRFPLLEMNKHLCSSSFAHHSHPLILSLARAPNFTTPRKRYAQSIFDLRRYKCRYTTIANLSNVWQLCSVLFVLC